MILTYHKHYIKWSCLITLMRISKFRVGKHFIHMALQVEESRQTPFNSSVMSWMCVHQGNQVTLPGRGKCSNRDGREKSKTYAEKESIIWRKVWEIEQTPLSIFSCSSQAPLLKREDRACCRHELKFAKWIQGEPEAYHKHLPKVILQLLKLAYCFISFSSFLSL